MRWLLAACILALPVAARAEVLGVARFAVVESESGPTSYYATMHEDGRDFIRAVYRPPLETVVVGVELSGEEKRRARRLRWSWRALALPAGGNACVPGKGDSAAAVYVTWKRGLRWYTLKYVWSAEAAAGTSCRRKRSAFSAQETIVLASGGPLMTWRSEEIDLAHEFGEHFGGDAPDLVGIGLMTDGDQTGSVSAADYAELSLVP